MNTLLLDRTAWDLILDSSGNIAIAQPPYALAQDVASAIRLFRGELWYDTTKGIPYFDEILGELPPTSVVLQLIERAALTVPGVVTARCTIQSFTSQQVTGTVEFIDNSGTTTTIGF